MLSVGLDHRLEAFSACLLYHHPPSCLHTFFSFYITLGKKIKVPTLHTYKQKIHSLFSMTIIDCGADHELQFFLCLKMFISILLDSFTCPKYHPLLSEKCSCSLRGVKSFKSWSLTPSPWNNERYKEDHVLYAGHSSSLGVWKLKLREKLSSLFG